MKIFYKNLLGTIFLLAIIEITVGRTITHRETTVNSKGEKTTRTWTTIEPDSSEDFLHHSSSDAVQTYFNNNPHHDTHGYHESPSNEELLRQMGVQRGMDPEAISEVLRTKQPVVKTSIDANGNKRTTTYKLDSDGTISSRTVTQMQPVLVKSDHTTHTWVPTNPQTAGSNPSPDDFPNWNNFQTHSFRKPEIDDSLNWEPFEEPQAETFDPTRKFHITDPKHLPEPSYNPPKPVKTTVRTTIKPTTPRHKVEKVTTPLPSLDDFLKSQYQPMDPQNYGQKPVKTINIENLPVTEILSDGKPVRDPNFLNRLPPELQPTLQTPHNTIKIEDIPLTREVTNIKSLTHTMQSTGTPNFNDLDPKMQEVLRRAGITPEDLKNIKGDTITKTREDPTGKKITTTFRVRPVVNKENNGRRDVEEATNLRNPTNGVPNQQPNPTFSTPSSPGYGASNTPPTQTVPTSNLHADNYSPPSTPQHHHYSPQTVHVPAYRPNKPSQHDAPYPRLTTPATTTATSKTNVPLTNYGNYPKADAIPNVQSSNRHEFHSQDPIASFLAKIGLTIHDIQSGNGEIIKTIVDDQGRILTATFVLSTIKGDSNQGQSDGLKNEEKKPIK